MKTNDIIVLDNDKHYTLMQQMKLNDNKYFYAALLDDNDQLVKDSYLFFKEIKENNDIYVEVVEDDNLVNDLIKKLKNTFK